MRNYLKLALSLPPHVVLRRAGAMIRDRAEAAVARRRDRNTTTYAAHISGPTRRLLPDLPAGLLDPHRDWIAGRANRIRRHEFDLLGSGPVVVAPGMVCAGVEGHVHSAAKADEINEANRAESRRLRAMIDPDYKPIDWHLDFKSGYRWSEACWYRDIPYGHVPGVDIKVPWELGRLQHLPLLAWGHCVEGGEVNAREFRNQVLDFLAANPPRFGVNWRCTMDVAIRAANLVMARELFRSTGTVFDEDFEAALRRSVLEHGRHIITNLEWFPECRGNHYLANIAGLAFVAAWLPAGPETDRWLAFAARELAAETALQFYPDGGNFEASVPYHRLSAEMVAYATSVLIGHGDEKFNADHFARMEAMAEFTAALTKPNGRIPQIGDNDSGRFLTLHPAEDDLDHSHLQAAIGALMGRSDPLSLDAWTIASLADGRAISPAPRPSPAFPKAVLTDLDPVGPCMIFAPGGGDLLEGLECRAWPDFGLWLFRSKRLYLAVRCGPIGLNGRGAHAHNDQLAMELTIDGTDWIADPGTYLYTPLPEWRNRYRSVKAHCAPHWGEREPGRLDLGLFWLGDEAKAQCLHFGPDGFMGEHRGYGPVVRRRIALASDTVTVVDSGLPWADTPATITCRDAAEAARFFGPALPASPGYGRRNKE